MPGQRASAWLGVGCRVCEAEHVGEAGGPAAKALFLDVYSTIGWITIGIAVLVLVILANAVLVWVRAISRGSLPTTEVPAQPSQLVAPADFVATAEEKEAVRAWEERQREDAGARR